MNTSDSLNTESKNLFNLISKNWEELDDSLKTKLIKIWRVLTYKWQLQILFNLPFLLWWALDLSHAHHSRKGKLNKICNCHL